MSNELCAVRVGGVKGDRWHAADAGAGLALTPAMNSRAASTNGRRNAERTTWSSTRCSSREGAAGCRTRSVSGTLRLLSVVDSRYSMGATVRPMAQPFRSSAVGFERMPLS